MPARVAKWRHTLPLGPRGRRVAVLVLLAALFCVLPATPVSAATRAPSLRKLAAAGGAERFAANIEGAAKCSWTASPRIRGFAASQACGPGTVSRSTTFHPNLSPDVASWIVTLRVSGAHPALERWHVREAAPVITYSASVGVSVTRNPIDPYQATYGYSANATTMLGDKTVNLGQLGHLPSGVLQFFSDGSLDCTMPVGGAVTGGSCTVNYSSLGQHSAVAQYEPGFLTTTVPYDSTSASFGPYATGTNEDIVSDGDLSTYNNGVYTTYSRTYTITAVTVDENGYQVGPFAGLWTFQLAGKADDGNEFETTLSAPPGQTTCTVTIEATLYDDYSSQTSSVSSSDCSGGIQTGNVATVPGNNVPGWFVSATFAPNSAGFLGSSSGTTDIVCEE